MKVRIKIKPDSLTKVGQDALEECLKVGRRIKSFIKTHPSSAAGISLPILIDDMRVRIKRRKTEKENTRIKAMTVSAVSKHEAEIQVLKKKADEYEAERRASTHAQSNKTLNEGE